MGADFRIGHGFDIHPFRAGKKLVLGGVEIPSEEGLDGHSDADVLLHTLCDALLGALGLGDIGTRYPNTEGKWRGAPSTVFLEDIMGEVERAGFDVVNCDTVILAEAPKMNPHIPRMKAVIAPLLRVEIGRVGIKATTMERLGAVGREEGIAVSGVVLLGRK